MPRADAAAATFHYDDAATPPIICLFAAAFAMPADTAIDACLFCQPLLCRYDAMMAYILIFAIIAICRQPDASPAAIDDAIMLPFAPLLHADAVLR